MEIRVRRTVGILVARVDGSAGQFQLIEFRVAHGDDLGIGLRQKPVQDAPTLRAIADTADDNPAAGRDLALPAQRRCRDDGGKSAGRERDREVGAKETAAGGFCFYLL